MAFVSLWKTGPLSAETRKPDEAVWRNQASKPTVYVQLEIERVTMSADWIPTAKEIALFLIAAWGCVLSTYMWFEKRRRAVPGLKFYHQFCGHGFHRPEGGKWLFASRIVNPSSKARITIDRIEIDTDDHGVGLVIDLQGLIEEDAAVSSWPNSLRVYEDLECRRRSWDLQFPYDLEPGKSIAFTIDAPPANISIRVGVVDGESRRHWGPECKIESDPEHPDRSTIWIPSESWPPDENWGQGTWFSRIWTVFRPALRSR